MKLTRRAVLSALLLCSSAFAIPAWAQHFALAHVITSSNALEGNQLLVFAHRWGEGLVQVASVPTGGDGTGAGLGSQGALIASGDSRFLFAVNAGSNSISVFRVHRRGLHLVGAFDSGGQKPISLAQHDNLLYVVNAGSDAIAGFTIAHDGSLAPLSGSVRSLSSAGSGPAQISFTPTGDTLVVTEKPNDNISTFPVGSDGRPGARIDNPSAGATPFGFGFDRFGHLLVTEAAGGAPDASTVSSYRVREDGSLDLQDGPVALTETAACWLVTDRSGRIAFTTNTGSGTISALKVSPHGRLRLLDPDGVAASTGQGSVPIDLALTSRGRLLYALSSATGEVASFLVLGKHLRPLQGASGLPASSVGLVAF